MYNVGFNYSFQHLAAAGYLVLYTNPRGSTGYGTDFGNAIHNAYPSVDYEDLMAGVDEVLKRGYADRSGSTPRASPAGVCCPAGSSATPTVSPPPPCARRSSTGSASPAPPTSPSGATTATRVTSGTTRKWLEHSPLMYVGNVTTPTLLMTGELDLRTPMGQTEEYFQALNAVGVPTRLVRFTASTTAPARNPPTSCARSSTC